MIFKFSKSLCFSARFLSKHAMTKIPTLSFIPHGTLETSLNAADALNADQPAIIVIQEWWGVNDQCKSHAQRIANGTIVIRRLYLLALTVSKPFLFMDRDGCCCCHSRSLSWQDWS